MRPAGAAGWEALSDTRPGDGGDFLQTNLISHHGEHLEFVHAITEIGKQLAEAELSLSANINL